MYPLRASKEQFHIPESTRSVEIKIDIIIQPKLFAEFMRHKLACFFKGYGIEIRISVERGHKNIHVAIKKDSGLDLTADEMDFLNDLQSKKGVHISFHQ
jgi:hypothetical protein